MKLSEKFYNDLENEKLIQKYLYDYVWISGSTTRVYPIMEWHNTIEIQVKTFKNVFNKFIKRFVETHKDEISDGWFSKKDGSCPASIVFYKKAGA